MEADLNAVVTHKNENFFDSKPFSTTQVQTNYSI